MQNGSFAAAVWAAKPKPSPNSIPLTAGMPNTSEAMRLSMQSNIGSPMPAGSPTEAHSMTPPTESCRSRLSAMSCCICSPAVSSRTGKNFSCAASRVEAETVTGSKGLSSTEPIERMCAPTSDAVLTQVLFGNRTGKAQRSGQTTGKMSAGHGCRCSRGSA